MQIAKDGISYVTYNRAVNTLRDALAKFNLTFDDVRWFVVAQADGRHTPCVMLSADQSHLMLAFVNLRISVVM